MRLALASLCGDFQTGRHAEFHETRTPQGNLDCDCYSCSCCMSSSTKSAELDINECFPRRKSKLASRRNFVAATSAVREHILRHLSRWTDLFCKNQVKPKSLDLTMLPKRMFKMISSSSALLSPILMPCRSSYACEIVLGCGMCP